MSSRERRRRKAELSGPDTLEDLVRLGLDTAKKARKHRKSLTGDNFYANKLAEIRADATNVFRDLTGQTAGDVSALAEMMQGVFAPSTPPERRTELARELVFALRTTWRQSDSVVAAEDSQAVFPLTVLTQAGRGYLVIIGRQMNGCFSQGWYDACAVMMRRLLEIVIIEAFEAKGISGKIKAPDGNYLPLTGLVQNALAETAWSLSRNSRRFLPQLRDLGHMSAHGRYFTAQKQDIERVRQACRVVVEEFLHHSDLV